MANLECVSCGLNCAQEVELVPSKFENEALKVLEQFISEAKG